MAAVRERVERQVDVVKVMASGGMVTTGTDVFTPQFSIGELRLLVEQAHAAGLPVTAHAHAAAAVDQAVAIGVDGIEHASYGDPFGRRWSAPGPCNGQAAGCFGRQRYSGVPHSRWLQRGSLDRWRTTASEETDGGPRDHARNRLVQRRMSLLRRMTTFGVRFISGSDAGIAPE